MRRSTDGFVSATGMFKIAFPWAAHAEEKAERDHLKTLDSTSTDEVAGNIWIEPASGMSTPVPDANTDSRILNSTGAGRSVWLD